MTQAHNNDSTQIGTAPLITVITVVYNGIQSLRKTILSVVNQDYPSIEYIVVDGGSTDGSIEMIKEYASRLVWKSEKDTGIYDAMNKGLGLAHGAYCCFLNCGDVFVDNTVVRRVVQSMANLSSPGIVYGNILVEKPDGALTERIAKEPCNIHRMYFCHQSAFVKTSIMSAYRFDEKYKMSADLKFFKQCYHNKHTFAHLHFPVVIYDTSGISHTQREKGLRENIAVINEMDKGLTKYRLTFRLYFVVYWRKLTGKD
jgi:glycosyltransferase involved in cell wall biosynthesis